MNVLGEITRVFDVEIEALVRVRDSLSDRHVEAVRLLYQCRGKVVVSGVGKSGLIAQKIAATLASTGTPAIFLHPGDAVHGTVGAVQPGDVIVAIGKSGESEELLSILPVVRSIGAPIIAITANADSTLARLADVVIVADAGPEACPLALAPTSSTTAALVIGDAIAVALMKMRNFQPEHFAQFHPGGQLGKRLLLTVGDIMRSGADNPVIRIDGTPRQMLVEMTSKRAGAVSVVDGEQRLLGLVTDYDVRRVLEQELDLLAMRVEQIMNRKPSFIFSDEKAITALEQMENREKPFLVLPVLNRETQRVVGLIHLHDLVARGL
jgi:arabinose-5-phosphate isomerase